MKTDCTFPEFSGLRCLSGGQMSRAVLSPSGDRRGGDLPPEHGSGAGFLREHGRCAGVDPGRGGDWGAR